VNCFDLAPGLAMRKKRLTPQAAQGHRHRPRVDQISHYFSRFFQQAPPIGPHARHLHRAAGRKHGDCAEGRRQSGQGEEGQEGEGGQAEERGSAVCQAEVAGARS
jgi:hypothetical protein